LGASRKYFINDKYFKVMTHEAASVIGFIIADGYIRNEKKRSSEVRIEVSIKDGSFLEKMKDVLEAENPIHRRLSEKRNNVILDFYSEEIVEDLISLGVCDDQKSYNQEWPKSFPEEYVSSLILGLMQGDGCISCYKNILKGGEERFYVTVNFLGTYSLLEGVQETVYDNTRVWAKVSLIKSIFKLQYYGKSAKKVLDYLYSGVSEGAIILDRKYERYLLVDKEGKLENKYEEYSNDNNGQI